jgi:hypothetical protein
MIPPRDAECGEYCEVARATGNTHGTRIKSGKSMAGNLPETAKIPERDL